MFPNARKGIKKLFIAEILTIFAAILGLVSTVINALPEVAAHPAGSIVLMVFALTSLFFVVVAFLLHLFGLFQGGRDSGHLRVAFWAVIFALVFSVAASVLETTLPSLPWLHTIFSTLAQVLNAFVIIYVISGISSLAVRVGRLDVARRGTIMIWIILGIYLVSALLNILSGIFTGEPFVVFFAVVSIASAVLDLVIYIAYLFYLHTGTKIF